MTTLDSVLLVIAAAHPLGPAPHQASITMKPAAGQIAATTTSPSPAAGQVLGRHITVTPTPRPAPKSTAALTPPVAKPAYIGLFVASSPSDPSFRQTLDSVAATGCNLIYNYTTFDGTPAQVNTYLAYAQSKGIKVIIGLQDLYDQLPGGAATAQTYAQYGATNDQIATTVVRDFQANPAVWGFSITDENPESTTYLAIWQPILAARYAQVKSLSTKPVMSVLVGWNDGNQATRRQLFQAIGRVSDVLAPDYYPIPFLPPSRISALVSDAATYQQTWFIEQAFSWSSYPNVIRGWGYDPALSRYPTVAEMLTMARSALAAGAQGLLLYSYFDINASPVQLDQVRQVVQMLEN